nr:MAG TPA: hypothetical protein [Caudoviricetes sp.]
MIQTSPYHTRADVWIDCNNTKDLTRKYFLVRSFFCRNL